MLPGSRYIIGAAGGAALIAALLGGVYYMGKRDERLSSERDAAVEYGEAMGRANEAESGIGGLDDGGVVDWLRSRAQ